MAQLGNVNKFYIKVSSTWTWLTGEQNNSFNRTAEAIEVSDKSTAWAQFIAGKKGATAEVTIFADNSNAAQKNVLASFNNGAEVDIFIGSLTGSSPSSGDAAKAIITAVNDTNDFGAVSTRSISLTITGAVTHYPAS